MAWQAYVCDTMTGLLDVPIDLPSFRWSVSVSNSSLSTTRDKGTESTEASGMQLPWGSIPANTAGARERMLASSRRALVLMWDDVPVVFGAIGDRTDTWVDTSFSLRSVTDILSTRYVIREGVYGTGTTISDSGDTKGQKITSVTTDSIHWSGLSLRAIACRAIQQATSKPGGTLPIDLPYLNEKGQHERTYDGFDVQNLSCADVLKKISNVSGGPDITFRPYMADADHVRLRVEAGSDSEPSLSQSGPVPMLTAFPGGGTLQDVKVSYLGPTMRVYGYGSGQDKAQLAHLSQDISLCQQADPWPLSETVVGFTDDDTAALVKNHTDGRLNAVRHPVCQIQGTVALDDASLGEMWPGYLVDLDLSDYPSLPDGTYHLRLMEMTGDAGSIATLVFDVMRNPWY